MPQKNLDSIGEAPSSRRPPLHMTATRQKRLMAQEKRNQVWALRLRGASLRQIGNQVGLSKSRVHEIIISEIAVLKKERLRIAERYLDQELARLDRLLLAVANQADAGDVAAVEASRRIIAERAKLLGLYAPVAVQHSGHVETSDDNVAWLVDRIKQIRDRPATPEFQETEMDALPAVSDRVERGDAPNERIIVDVEATSSNGSRR